jgi:hypothetical protein
MQKVAGILIRHAMAQRIKFRRKSELREEFRHVACFCRERTRLRVFWFVRRKKMIVFLERGPATRSIRDNGVEIVQPKRPEVLSRQFPRSFAESRMRGKRAAAALFSWQDDFAAVCGEHPDGGFLQLGKSDVGDAAGKESHTRAPRTYRSERRPDVAEEKFVINAREKPVAFRQAQQLQNADAARDGLQARTLIQAREAGRIFDEMRSGEKLLEEEVACGARDPGALVRALDASAGVLDQFPVLDAGRAGRFAGAAVKAFVDMLDKGIADARLRLGLASQRRARLRRRDTDLALKDVKHLVDPPARRIRFQIPQSVCGTRVEAQPAMDAPRVILVRRHWSGNGRCGHGWSAQQIDCTEGEARGLHQGKEMLNKMGHRDAAQPVASARACRESLRTQRL